VILEALEEDDALECIGEHIPSGWAFAWLDDAGCGSFDLGGWLEDDDIEVARLIVRERELRPTCRITRFESYQHASRRTPQLMDTGFERSPILASDRLAAIACATGGG